MSRKALNEIIAAYISEVEDLGVKVPWDVAEHAVTRHVDYMAEIAGIQRRSVLRYVFPHSIRNMAEHDVVIYRQVIAELEGEDT